jgi:hypothetical protein
MKGKGPSPNMEFKCSNCNRFKIMKTSSSYGPLALTGLWLLMIVLLTGSTFQQIHSMFSLLGIHILSESYYHQKAVPTLENAIETIFKSFIKDCRNEIEYPNDVHLIIDAGWSHPGWWARECTVLAIDGKTGLPVGLCHVIKGENYNGSSKGKCI